MVYKKRHRGKAIKAIIFHNKIYDSVKEAALLTHYSESTIRRAIGKKPRKRKRP